MRNIIQNQKTTWIDITKPSKEDVNYLMTFILGSMLFYFRKKKWL